MRRSLLRLRIPLRRPFVTAGGVVAARELVVLRLEDDDGAVGCGEAAPLEPYDGVSVERVIRALQDGARGGPPQAHAAEEMARLDLEARRAGRPLGEPGAVAIAVNLTLPAGPPDEVAARAGAGVRAGYSCFKVKVGLPDDLERVRAVRAAVGPWPALRLDANGAWTPAEAIRAVAALAPFDIQLVEQPCRSLEEMAVVRRAVPMPLAADESIASPADVRAAARARACDVVNIKLAGSGGFGAAREAIREAECCGLRAYLSSTLDGPWGIAAALQLAASEGVSLACGLATLQLFDARIARALPAPTGGLLAVPEGPGLGVTVDDDALAEVLVEELEQ
ncbi:MAG TPA: mandelate racemase/muconate lactonizing enzyme family protein [Thermoleophilaceae bacterium]|nr:mandelate racemase/muconate lactonizing enzyme family protein [Thermoleophilaceae bacterium]